MPKASRFGAAAAAALVMSVLVVPTASATSAFAENDQLRVTASLASNNEASADRATDGDVVTAVGSVTNKTRKQLAVTLSVTLDSPDDLHDYSKSRKVSLKPGETLQEATDHLIDESYGAGVYYLTVQAESKQTVQSTTASIEVYR